MIVSDKNERNFCCALPSQDPEAPADELHIIVPNSLQMGWCESPPLLCSATKTARYVMQSFLHTKFPPHNFEAHMIPPPQEAETDVDYISDIMSNVTLLEVFIDDFIAPTDDFTQDHLLQVSRAMLRGINTVFPTPEVTFHNGGKPISEKKLANLDGIWDHIKEIMGWIMDGANSAICLPPKKADKTIATLKFLRKRKKLKILEFQKSAGTLHHAATGIPGGRSLFTTIWAAMENCKKNWITITPTLDQVLRYFK